MGKKWERKFFFHTFTLLNNSNENVLYYREDEKVLQRMRIVRKYLSDMNIMEAVGLIQDRMKKTKDYEEFLMSMNELKKSGVLPIFLFLISRLYVGIFRFG